MPPDDKIQNPLAYWSSRSGKLSRMGIDFSSCPGMLTPIHATSEVRTDIY
jgi:hypothetical protein